MINFIWPPGEKLLAGTGGSENYTVGQVKALLRAGIDTQIITIGLGADDGREGFDDIPFLGLPSETEIQSLDGTVVFINGASRVPTKQPAFILMHVPPFIHTKSSRELLWLEAAQTANNCTFIVTSKYAALTWAGPAHRNPSDIRIVYPFAESCFAVQARKPKTDDARRILFAGRLSAEKGIYTLLEALHLHSIGQHPEYIFTITAAGSDFPAGKVIHKMLSVHPNVRLIPARKTPKAMAELMAEQDVVVMPSNSQYWHETFGIVSIEAQHAGCRVVASDDGGLPETNCGGVILVAPDNAEALAQGINKAIADGPLPVDVRRKAAHLFTVEQSVGNLLKVLFPSEELPVQPNGKLTLKPSTKNC